MADRGKIGGQRGMQKFKGSSYEEYKAYTLKRRKKSTICVEVDKALKQWKKENKEELFPILNGHIEEHEKNPYCYECTLVIGSKMDNGKIDRTTNYYSVRMYSGIKGVTVYKAINGSIHYRCFVCGDSLEPFGYNHWSAGCRVCEELTIDEIIKNIINKDWIKFNGIERNIVNITFLKCMKQRLIKTLLYNKIIYRKQDGTYEDYKYYGLIK